ncbi:hypothetical protein G7Y89_g14 [Cudoniella acicularis]|uniref:Uncharacterized protein n=1 Tax=Cudoniella acicularis TaxID=354080 RepID=A0A8H4S005_9HELO|nr:hypothetical protein G7Y89_g14 [Cudoniella acicularis]
MSSTALPGIAIPKATSTAFSKATRTAYEHPPFFHGVRPAFLAKNPCLCFAAAALSAGAYFVVGGVRKEIKELKEDNAMERRRVERLEKEVSTMAVEIRRWNLGGR